MSHRADHDVAGADDLAAPPSRTGGAPGRSTVTSRLWRSPRRDDRGVAPGAEDAVAQLGGGGAPLPDGVRARFEQSLGADLGGVRVHTDDASATAADAVGARAFARGNDIHFGAGQYQPDDPFGLHLLAHEVAHTVQQSGGAATTQYKLAVSSPGEAAEVEADHAADAMVAGHAASVRPSGGHAIARQAGPAASGSAEKLRPKFDAAVNLIVAKFGLIAQQQATAVSNLAALAAKEDESLGQTVVTKAVEAGLGFALPAIGGELVAAVKSPAGQQALKWAYDKAQDKVKDVVKGKVAESYKPKKGADSYFLGLALSFPAMAGHQQERFVSKMNEAWDRDATSDERAQALLQEATTTKDEMQAKLDTGSYIRTTRHAAVDGWSTALAQQKLGHNFSKPGEAGTDMYKAYKRDPGVLHLEMRIKGWGGQLPTITSAALPGLSEALLKSDEAQLDHLSGRNLGSIKIPKTFRVYAPGTAIQFWGGVNELGVVWVTQVELWRGLAKPTQDQLVSNVGPFTPAGLIAADANAGLGFNPSLAWLYLRGGGPDAVGNAGGQAAVYTGMERFIADCATLTLGGLF